MFNTKIESFKFEILELRLLFTKQLPSIACTSYRERLEYSLGYLNDDL